MTISPPATSLDSPCPADSNASPMAMPPWVQGHATKPAESSLRLRLACTRSWRQRASTGQPQGPLPFHPWSAALFGRRRLPCAGLRPSACLQPCYLASPLCPQGLRPVLCTACPPMPQQLPPHPPPCALAQQPRRLHTSALGGPLPCPHAGSLGPPLAVPLAPGRWDNRTMAKVAAGFRAPAGWANTPNKNKLSPEWQARGPGRAPSARMGLQ